MPRQLPPEEHRFKPGAEWRGNAKGRPRKCPLTERFEDFIEGSELISIGKDGKAQRTRLPDGLTVADMIVLAWAKKAMLGDAMARKDALERLEGKVAVRVIDETPPDDPSRTRGKLERIASRPDEPGEGQRDPPSD